MSQADRIRAFIADTVLGLAPNAGEPRPQPDATDDWFQSLRGLLRGAFDDVGGPDAYLRRERENFYDPGRPQP